MLIVIEVSVPEGVDREEAASVVRIALEGEEGIENVRVAHFPEFFRDEVEH